VGDVLRPVGSRRRIAGTAGLRAALWAGAALLLLNPIQAFAEFEIPEVDGEKGGLEMEYRGAQHWGYPRPDEDGDIDALRQSHEVEIQYAIADWWMVRITPNFEEPADDEIDIFTVGVETQFVLVPRKGGKFGLALMAGYEPADWFVDVDDPDEVEFGPVAEFAIHKWLLTLNPRIADQEELGFEYAAQLQYRFAAHWSGAVMAFGEIEELAHTGPFNAQTHAIGPSLYWFQSAAEEEETFEGERKAEWSAGLGTLFGLTSQTADVTLRATLRMEY
jgi:hypothetical protein